jgi:hypothetical protein
MLRQVFYLAVLLSCSMFFAQSVTKEPQAARVYISGRTRQCGKSIATTSWVRFDGRPPLTSVLVKTDDSGRYRAELPLGSWTMTLLASLKDTTELARPRHFDVNAAGMLVFDIYLRPPVMCSVRGTPEQRAATCWGEEFYELPSAKGEPFEVDLFNLRQHWTQCLAVEAETSQREFATYNLLSIEADNVVYLPSEQTLEAKGHVRMQDESGEHETDSIRLWLRDGQVVALRQDR